MWTQQSTALGVEQAVEGSSIRCGKFGAAKLRQTELLRQGPQVPGTGRSTACAHCKPRAAALKLLALRFWETRSSLSFNNGGLPRHDPMPVNVN